MLDLNQAGVLPLIPLTRFSEEPAVMFEMCRERIDRLAPPDQRDNMLAIAATMTAFRYNDSSLFDIFMRRLTVSDNPFLAGIAREAVRGNAHEIILESLEENFGPVPEEVQQRVRRITDEVRLRVLIRKAIRSESLQKFLEQMDLASSSTGG